MALDRVDSLEAALAKVPMLCLLCGKPSSHDGILTTLMCLASRYAAHSWAADGPGLAAAAREWMRERIPQRTLTGFSYDNALLDVMQALGLEP